MVNIKLKITTYLKKILWVGALLLTQISFAQSPILNKYIAEGLESNLALKQENLALDKSIEVLREAKGLFMPHVSFNASYTRAGGGRSINFPVGDLLNPVYQTLNQVTGTDGFPMIENVNEQFLPNDFHETKFRVIQPLFNSDIYFNYQAKRDLISVQKAQKETYEQELVKEIKTAYFRYLQSVEALEIYDETKLLLAEILRVNRKLVENQKATKDVIYGAEYELSQLDQEIAEAEKNNQLAKSYFNFLLNRDLEDTIEVDANLLEDSENVPQASLSNQQDISVQNRKEFSQLQSAMNANGQLENLYKFNAYPKLNLVFDAGYQGFGYTFDNNQDFWLGQVSLQWDLFKGSQNRSKIQQTKIDREVLTTQYDELENQIRLQVKEQYFGLQAAQKSEIAARSALRSVRENFRIAKRKYEENQLSFYELLEVRTRFTNAQLAYSIAQFDVLISQAELERARGNFNN